MKSLANKRSIWRHEEAFAQRDEPTQSAAVNRAYCSQVSTWTIVPNDLYFYLIATPRWSYNFTDMSFAQ